MKFLGFILILVISLTSLVSPVHAQIDLFGGEDGQTACGLLGCEDNGIDISRFDNLNVVQILSLVASLIFVSIIALGIFYIIKGSFKILRSEGDVSKVEEGSKIFKGVFIGIIMILAGIVGLVLMLALFNAGGVTNINPELPPTA